MVNCSTITIVLCIVLLNLIVNANQQYFETLNNRSYEVYKVDSIDTINKKFTCTNPNAIMFGGFGNLMFTALSAQIVATMLNRVPVMNHRLILDMFAHPDSRQSWNLISADDFPKLKAQVKTRPQRCGDVKTVSFAAIPAKYGTNGCFQAYFSHPEAAKVLSSLIPLQYPEANITAYDQWAATMAEWMMSRQTDSWGKIMDEYKNRTFAPCGNSTTKADLAVQFRTWRDLSGGSKFHEVGGVCHQHCAHDMALHTMKRLNRPICVFITSDNDTSSDILARSLNSLAPGKIQAVYGVEHNPTNWHSSDAVENARWPGPAYKSSELVRHQELKDWMLLGEAGHALYTAGSTFAVTARLRAGVEAQFHDRTSVTAEGTVCTCPAVYPNYHVEHQMQIRERIRARLLRGRKI